MVIGPAPFTAFGGAHQILHAVGDTLVPQLVAVQAGPEEGDPASAFRAVLRGAEEVPRPDAGRWVHNHLARPGGRRAGDASGNLRHRGQHRRGPLHLGPAGTNGPVLATLYGGLPFHGDGPLAPEIISEAEIQPVPAAGFGGTLAELVDAMRAGATYVNVHTDDHPSGEIRGQIVPVAVVPDDQGTFADVDTSVHEADIDWLAAAGITKGCNPPDNTLYCPEDDLTRGQMAAFLTRALGLRVPDEDAFADDAGSTFENDTNAIAQVGITKGCNPPANDRFCPEDDVTRAEMASFLARALGLGA